MAWTLAWMAWGLAAPSDLATLAAELQAVSSASPRPPECTGPVSSRGDTWFHAEQRGMLPFCLHLANGYAKLSREPGAALRSARAAAKAVPERLDPLVLEARALVRLGLFDKAWHLFKRVEKFDETKLRGPSVLHEMAVSATISGDAQRAAALYATLVPRSSLIGGRDQRQQIYVEAAVSALALAAGGELPKVQAYLDEAQRHYHRQELGTLARLTQALILLHSGALTQARRLAFELPLPRILELSEVEDDFDEDATVLIASLRKSVEKFEPGSARLPLEARLALSAAWHELNGGAEGHEQARRLWRLLKQSTQLEFWSELADAAARR